MDAYVINLDKRPDRWQQIQEDWANTSINLIRFKAVEHKFGAVGCARSHLALVQYAKDNKMPFILVLEDDAIPTDYFSKLWKRTTTYIGNHFDEWDIFNGGPSNICKKYIQKLTSTFWKTDNAKGTHFIIYNQRCYDKVLSWESLPEKLEDRPAIDEYISYPYLGLQMYGVYPFISVQRPGFSDIMNGERTYSQTFKQMEEKVKKELSSK